MELLGLWAEVVGGDWVRVVRTVKAIKCLCTMCLGVRITLLLVVMPGQLLLYLYERIYLVL